MEQKEPKENEYALTLHQYGPHSLMGIGEYKLVTTDAHCLKVNTYLRMCGAPFTTVNSNSKGIPTLAINHDKLISGSGNIIKYLNTNGFVIPFEQTLSPLQKSEILVYSGFIEEKLYKYQLFNWWAEVTNYSIFTHNIYGGYHKFPLNWWIPKTTKSSILKALAQDNLSIDSSKKVYKAANECYRSLSTRLGNQKFFFGNEPSVLDATAYAFLMTQYAANLPKDDLRKLIANYKNLVDFCNRITEEYFTEYEQMALNHQPFTKYIEMKKHHKKSPEELTEEQRSGYVILGGLIVLAVYSCFFNEHLREIIVRNMQDSQVAIST